MTGPAIDPATFMPSRDQAASEPADKLPDELYIGFVDSLLADTSPVFFSALSIAAIEMIAAIAAKNLLLCYWTSAPLFVAAIRLCFMQRLAQRRPIADMEVARKHELIFAIGAAATLTTISTWALAAYCLTDDPFVRVISVTMTIAFAFSMTTRNFAIDKGLCFRLFRPMFP